MRIEVQRIESSQAIVYEDAINAYTKGPLYCILFLKDGKRITHKYPVASLFRIVEDYADSKR